MAKFLFTKGNNYGFKKGNKGYWTGKKRPEMVGNTHGFKVGNKINLGRSQDPWNKNKTAKDDNRIKVGAESNHWKGGLTPINKKIRHSLEMKLWRKAIFERDNFTCQKYGVRGGILRPHHINNFSEFPELRFALDNGITLSEKAHIEFHQLYGRYNNTREQLEEFLAS